MVKLQLTYSSSFFTGLQLTFYCLYLIVSNNYPVCYGLFCLGGTALWGFVLHYTVTAQDGTIQKYVASVGVAKKSDCNITEFKLGKFSSSVISAIDPNSNAITAIVPFGTDVAALVPTILISDGAKIRTSMDVAANFSVPVTYTVTAQDGTPKTYTVSVTVGKNVQAKISTFKLDKLKPAVNGIIDESNKTILLNVSFGTSVTSLILSISISEKAMVLPASGVAVDFTSDVTYMVTSESGIAVPYTVKAVVQKFAPVISSVSCSSIVKDEALSF